MTSKTFIFTGVEFLKTSLILPVLWFPSDSPWCHLFSDELTSSPIGPQMCCFTSLAPLHFRMLYKWTPILCTKKTNMNSCFLSPHTSPPSLSPTSLLLPYWMRHYICDFEMFLWSFLLYRLHPLQRKVNYCTQTQLFNPADRRSNGRLLCFGRVWMKSWDFSQHPFTRGQSKKCHFFVAKVLSLYQCFQHRRIFANGTTSAVSCVTMASGSKPLNYYTLDRGTKEDVELFKVP